MAKDDLAIVVFTADTLDWILRHGGSGDWVVSAKKADSCKYIARKAGRLEGKGSQSRRLLHPR